jgi:hypothetical protein
MTEEVDFVLSMVVERDVPNMAVLILQERRVNA